MPDSPPKPKRRWYQFSLRTLIVSVVIGGAVFGWIGMRMNQARDNRERVAAVEKAVDEIGTPRGEVESEYKQLRSATCLEELFDDPGSPDDPVGVLNVSIVTLSGTDVTDADLEHLKEFTDLKQLALCSMFHFFISGSGRSADDPPQLFDVTDTGLEHLKSLTNLEDLGLADSKITDAGLEHLKGLTKLTSLSLRNTDVTDAGLEHVKELTNMRTLHLHETNVTAAGVRKLKQALPNCKIVHDY